MSIPITDLERRLSTEQTLDIFTMQPKVIMHNLNMQASLFTSSLASAPSNSSTNSPLYSRSPHLRGCGHDFHTTIDWSRRDP